MKYTKQIYATKSAEVFVPNMDFRYDDTIGRGGSVRVTVKKQDIDIYPWGAGNRLPNEMIALLRSNGDVMNLLDARLDFLFGAGVGVFRRQNDNKDVVFEPFFASDLAEYLLEYEINDYVDGCSTQLVECSTAFVNIAKDGNYSKLIPIDPLTARCERLKAGEWKKKRFVVSANWKSDGQKRAALVPAYDFDNVSNPDDTILQLMRPQSGQFYYGYPKWWAAAEWIKLANRVPKFHNQALDTEYNVAYICRIADQYFETMFQVNNIENDEDKQKYRDEFYKMMDDIVYSNEGKRRVIYDECPVGEDGKMQPWIDLVPIKRSITGNEYSELYRTAVLAFANASGILSQLSGINDGKVMGGSGSELRVTAEYQQFYRTPRERELILKPLNRIILPEIRKKLNLPADACFGFNNILLESLDKAKTGSSQIGTGGPNAQKQPQTTSQK